MFLKGNDVFEQRLTIISIEVVSLLLFLFAINHLAMRNATTWKIITPKIDMNQEIP